LRGAHVVEFKSDEARLGPTAQKPDGAVAGGRAEFDDEVGACNASEQTDERSPGASDDRDVLCCGLLLQARQRASLDSDARSM
jgi:hypothetical protein